VAEPEDIITAFSGRFSVAAAVEAAAVITAQVVMAATAAA
jgi:hypothetical protein